LNVEVGRGARHYRRQVEADEPDAEVRIVRTMRLRITTYATGDVQDGDIRTEIVA